MLPAVSHMLDSPGAAAQLCSRANPLGCRSGAVLHLRAECETVSAQHPVGQAHLGQLSTEEGGRKKKKKLNRLMIQRRVKVILTK